MKKKMITSILAMAVAASMLAGCGSGSASQKTEETEAAASSAEEETEAAEEAAASSAEEETEEAASDSAESVSETEEAEPVEEETETADAAESDATEAGGEVAADGSHNYDFVFVCPIMGLEYWNMCIDGIEAADADYGTTTQVLGSTDPNTALQDMVNYLSTSIAAKPDGIFSYAGIEFMPELIKEAADAGIPFVAVDSDSSDTSNRIAYVGTDPYNAGFAAGEAMVEATGGEGTVAILMSSLSAEKEMAEIEAFKDAIKDTNLEIVVTEETGGDLSTGVVKMEAIAHTYPDLTAVLGTSAYDVQAAAKVKEEYNLDCHLIGYDDQEDTLNYIRKGTIDAIIVQDPYMMGYESVRTLVEYIENGSVEERVDTGTITVNADNVDSYK